MITIQISAEANRLLIQLLETCISDLRMEITQTDSLDYKEMLKGNKALLIKILDAAREAEPSVIL
jgi:hypothetical protein